MIVTEVVRDLDEVIRLLTDEEQVVGMFQGPSEWGPRALGNRSILLIPLRRENIIDPLLELY